MIFKIFSPELDKNLEQKLQDHPQSHDYNNQTKRHSMHMHVRTWDLSQPKQPWRHGWNLQWLNNWNLST